MGTWCAGSLRAEREEEEEEDWSPRAERGLTCSLFTPCIYKRVWMLSQDRESERAEKRGVCWKKKKDPPPPFFFVEVLRVFAG